MRLFSVQLPLVPLVVGQEIDRAAWPAHITLIGNFRASAADAAVAATARFAVRTPPLSAVVQEEAWFGPGGTVLVDRVEERRLRALHTELLDELEEVVGDLELDLPHHTRGGYLPHRTVTAGARPRPGDVLEATTVSIAELDPPGGPGTAVILGVWPLVQR